MIKVSTIAAVTLISLIGAEAAAAKAFGTITFDQPTGTTVSTADIPVFVTLTIDPTSEALSTGPDAQITSGLTDADITAAGYDPTVFTNRIINNAFECSGTFVQGCGSPTAGAYHFEFNFDPPSLIGPPNLDIQPGQSFSYRFRSFVPNDGNAAPGLYTFYNVIPEFELTNADFSQVKFITIASSCINSDPACAFTRVVTAAPGVPEPAAWALLTVGFGVVGSALRRRPRATVAA